MTNRNNIQSVELSPAQINSILEDTMRSQAERMRQALNIDTEVRPDGMRAHLRRQFDTATTEALLTDRAAPAPIVPTTRPATAAERRQQRARPHETLGASFAALQEASRSLGSSASHAADALSMALRPHSGGAIGRLSSRDLPGRSPAEVPVLFPYGSESVLPGGRAIEYTASSRIRMEPRDGQPAQIAPTVINIESYPVDSIPDTLREEIARMRVVQRAQPNLQQLPRTDVEAIRRGAIGRAMARSFLGLDLAQDDPRTLEERTRERLERDAAEKARRDAIEEERRLKEPMQVMITSGYTYTRTGNGQYRVYGQDRHMARNTTFKSWEALHGHMSKIGVKFACTYVSDGVEVSHKVRAIEL